MPLWCQYDDDDDEGIWWYIMIVNDICTRWTSCDNDYVHHVYAVFLDVMMIVNENRTRWTSCSHLPALFWQKHLRLPSLCPPCNHHHEDHFITIFTIWFFFISSNGKEKVSSCYLSFPISSSQSSHHVIEQFVKLTNHIERHSVTLFDTFISIWPPISSPLFTEEVVVEAKFTKFTWTCPCPEFLCLLPRPTWYHWWILISWMSPWQWSLWLWWLS